MLMIVGLALFIGIHAVPMIPPLRQAVAAGIGEQRYKGLFTLVSFAGLILIVWGYRTFSGNHQLFPSSPTAITLAPFAVTLALILFAAANMHGHTRATLKHPMLIGLLIWATVHLFANGDLRGTILFGSFLVYGVIDLISAIARHAVKAFEPDGKFDAMAIGGGIVVALLFMLFHRFLFGVPAVPFSL
jgi:uncharacterized membrane protein